MNKTVTVVAAWKKSRWDEAVEGANHLTAGAAASLTADVAEFASWWLSANEDAAGLGFTVTPSWGGGAGWDVEPGCTFVFAGVPAKRVLAVARFARALKGREEQEAVAVLVRDEGFSLV